MFDELSSFIGLIVYELDEVLFKYSMFKEGDYVFEEMRESIIKIQVKLRWIQTKLKRNESDLNDIQNINKLDEWIGEYNDVIPSLSYGHCFVAKSICKKNKMKDGREIEFLSKLEIFLEKLGYYMNTNIYFIE